MLHLRPVAVLQMQGKLQAEVETFSEGTWGSKGHMSLEDSWVFSTFTASLVEDVSTLFPAGCGVCQSLAAAQAHRREAELVEQL